MRQLSEAEIDHLEQYIPELGIQACGIARARALASEHSVIESRDGALVLTEPAGTQTVIGSVPPRTRVKTNVVIKVKSRRSDSLP